MLPDRIETGTYAMAVAMTGGDVMLEGSTRAPSAMARSMFSPRPARQDHPDQCDGIRVKRNGAGISPVDVTTAPFPGFPTDLQAQFMALMTKRLAARPGSARRSSRIASCMSGSSPVSARASGSTETPPIVEGVERLKGAPVMATDLRASVSLVIAALAAEGETMVNRVYHSRSRLREPGTEASRAAAPSIERVSSPS